MVLSSYKFELDKVSKRSTVVMNQKVVAEGITNGLTVQPVNIL